MKKKGAKVLARKKGNAKVRNSKLATASNMPPLYHTLPGEDFHHTKSEVLKWLSKRPALISYIYDQAKAKGEIIYDHATGKWQGVEWEAEDDD